MLNVSRSLKMSFRAGPSGPWSHHEPLSLTALWHKLERTRDSYKVQHGMRARNPCLSLISLFQSHSPSSALFSVPIRASSDSKSEKISSAVLVHLMPSNIKSALLIFFLPRCAFPVHCLRCTFATAAPVVNITLELISPNPKSLCTSSTHLFCGRASER